MTATLDILHKQVVRRTGFYFELSWSSMRSVLHTRFIKPYLCSKLQMCSCKNHLWSMRSAKKKSIIMLSKWKISPSVFSVIFSAKSRLLGFCGWKSGQREMVNCRIIMNNGPDSAKHADINLHQQNWSRCAFLNTQQTVSLRCSTAFQTHNDSRNKSRFSFFFFHTLCSAWPPKGHG